MMFFEAAMSPRVMAGVICGTRYAVGEMMALKQREDSKEGRLMRKEDSKEDRLMKEEDSKGTSIDEEGGVSYEEERNCGASVKEKHDRRGGEQQGEREEERKVRIGTGNSGRIIKDTDHYNSFLFTDDTATPAIANYITNSTPVSDNGPRKRGGAVPSSPSSMGVSPTRADDDLALVNTST